MTNIYVNAELSRELEELGVKRLVYSEVVISGRKLNEDVEIKRIEVPGSLTIFDLLYPENAVMVFGKLATRKARLAVTLWQHPEQGDWQAFVAEAVERRKAE